MKRALIIFAAVIVLIGLGVGAYFLFFSSKPSLTVGTTGNPFGDTGSGDVMKNPAVTTPAGSAGVEVAPRLVRITSSPVSFGTAVFDALIPSTDVPVASTSSSSPPAMQLDVSVRYIDRASGNVFNYLAHKRQLIRLSNRTLPGIQTASWLRDGSVAYVQFLSKEGSTETVKSYALPANGTGGFFLEDNLSQVNGVGSSTLFSLLTSSQGSTGTIAKSDGTNVRTLFSSLLSLLTVMPAGSQYFAYTKPANTIPGYAFLINPNGSTSRILGPATGLSILPNASGTSVLYSYVTGGTVRLGVMNVATRTQTSLPLATFSEKCVWTSDGSAAYCAVPTALTGTLPDDWYQGAVSFTDRIWKIDLSGRVATLIVDPSTVAKTPIDAVNLSLDANNDVLVFTDKATGALWAYDL